MNEESILTSIKKLLGPTSAYDAFDTDIILHINSAFMSLQQIGIGPSEGFMIEDDEEVWNDFIDVEENPDMLTILSAVKTFIYIKVKLVFDPPTNSAVLQSLNKILAETEWRLNVEAESK